MSKFTGFVLFSICSLTPTLSWAAPPSQAECDSLKSLKENEKNKPLSPDDTARLAECLSTGTVTNTGQQPPAQLEQDRLEAAQGLIQNAIGTSTAVVDLKKYDWRTAADREQRNKGWDDEMPKQAVEFVSVLADVAVKRAKQNGLAYLQDRLVVAVCGAKLEMSEDGKTVRTLRFGSDVETKKKNRNETTTTTPGSSDPTKTIVLFPSTCALVQHTSLERIASEPEVLAATVAEDLTAVIAAKLLEQLEMKDVAAWPTVKNLMKLSVQVTARTVRTKNFSIQVSDVRAIIDAIIADHINQGTVWGANQKGLVVGVAALAYAVTGASKEKDLPNTDISALVAKLCSGTVSCTVDNQFEAVQVASLGIKAMTAIDDDGAPDVAARAKSAVQFVFMIANKVAEEQQLGQPQLDMLAQVETLILSALDRDIPRSLSAAAELMEIVCDESSCCKAKTARYKYDIADLVTLLSSIATYSSTYMTVAEGQDQPSAEELREARTAALEAAIDVLTNRHNRHGDWVGSLGLPVGFSGGGQSFNRDGLQTPEPMLPQLSLPLGLAIQRLPGKHHREGERPGASFYWDGFHAMVTAVDLGQFVAYDAGGAVSTPTWASFMSLGGQLGWLVGSPANSFVVAAEIRYAPSLFPEDETRPLSDGAVRFGLFLAYHVSLFDFN